MDYARAAELLEHTARSVYDARGPHDMHPGQWAVLRFLEKSDEARRDLNGVAAHLNITPGPASRAIAALARKKLIRVEPMESDRRKRVIEVTAQGLALLKEDPLGRLAEAIRTLPEEDAEAFLRSLTHIRRALGGD